MWLLPSKNRPRQCAEALAAFREFGCTEGVVWVDGDPEGYEELNLPDGWFIKYGSGGIVKASRWQYETYPDLSWYGWLADDMRPATPEFDLKLLYECEGINFVYCNGGGHKTPWVAPESSWDAPRTIPSAMMWGGRLVRTVGWLAPPWLERTCLDELWKHLSIEAGVARYRHDVVVKHFHWLTGGRKKDEVDCEAQEAARADKERLELWLASQEFKEEVLRITKTFGSRDERWAHYRPMPWATARNRVLGFAAKRT